MLLFNLLLDSKLTSEKEDLQTWVLSGKLDTHKGTKKIERKPTKAESEEDVSEEDRKLHERIAAEVKAQLEAKGKATEGVETFEEFYGLLQSEAVLLQKKYQPQLRKGIKIAVDLVNSVKQDEKDGDVDIKVRIAPNATEIIVPVEYSDDDINEAAYKLIDEHEKGNLGGGGTAVIVMMEHFAARKKDGYTFVSLVSGTRHHTELVESEAAFNNLTNGKSKKEYKKELKPELKQKINVLLKKRTDALQWIATFNGATFESRCQEHLIQLSSSVEKEDFITDEAEDLLKTISWISSKIAREFAQQWLKVRMPQRDSDDNKGDLKPIRKALSNSQKYIDKFNNGTIDKKQKKLLKKYKKVILSTSEAEIRKLGSQVVGQNQEGITDLIESYKTILPQIQSINI